MAATIDLASKQGRPTDDLDERPRLTTTLRRPESRMLAQTPAQLRVLPAAAAADVASAAASAPDAASAVSRCPGCGRGFCCRCC